MPESFSLMSGVNAQSWQTAQEDRVSGGLKNSSPANKEKLENSARAFESLLIGKWLEDAEKTLATVPGADEDEEGKDESMKQFSSLGTQALAESISAKGGIGIARMLMKAFESKQNAEK